VDAHGRLPYTYAPVPSINSCDTPVAVSSAVPTSVPQPTRGPSAAGVTKHVTWNFFTSGSPDCFASLTKDDLNSGLFAGAENIPADCGKTASFTYNGVTVTATYAWRTTGGQGYNELSPQAFANLLGVQVNVANFTRAEALQLPINDPGYVVVGASWLWYDEEETFWNYGSNTCNGDWAKCGHFSNLISPDVKSIACGWSQCANGNYVWCNYNTPVKNPKVSPIRGITKPQLLASLVV
ncbi:hypothetical protein DYB36_010464, partial [Aphanomyces astaci]